MHGLFFLVALKFKGDIKVRGSARKGKINNLLLQLSMPVMCHKMSEKSLC